MVGVGPKLAAARSRKWTADKLKEEALKYEYKVDFIKKAKGAYRSAKILGIYEEITAHMSCGYEKVKRENTFYTPEIVREEASKFNSPTDFHQNARTFYLAAQRLGILADVTKHMDRAAKPNGYWTLDRLMKEASKYKTRKEFAKSNYAAFCATYRHPQKTEILASLESTNWITRNTGMVYPYLTKRN